MKKKIILIFFGVFLSFVVLEVALGLGGVIFLTLQEHRNKISLEQQGTYRILCLGESTTAMGRAYSYPRQLEEILDQYNILGVKFSVINKGTGGSNTSAILDELVDNLNKYKPEMVVTMMGINDNGIYEPYAAMPDSRIMRLFRSLRTYKLTRLLWLHIAAKAKELKCHGKELNVPQADSIPKEKLLKKIIEQNPRNDGAYVELAKLSFDQGKLSQGVELYKKAIELNPKNERAYTELGWFYCDRRKPFQAKELFEKALELNKRNFFAYMGLGRVYMFEEGRQVKCEEAYKKSLECNPYYYYTYILLGSFYRNHGRFTQAEELFKKALKLNFANDRFYSALALLYETTGRYELAGEFYKKADEARMQYYNPTTRFNYQEIKKILNKRNIKLVCVQYPVRSVEPLKKMVGEDAAFVDNEKVFKDALKKANYDEYFSDLFGGDFGHCTPKGNRLLAQQVASVILKEVFKE